MYTITQACFASIPETAFSTITAAQVANMQASRSNNQCSLLSAKQFSNIPVNSLIQGSSSQTTGLQYGCSKTFNDDAVSSISSDQLKAIAPLAFANIPVNAFKKIPSDAFTTLTPEQTANMRSSSTNNQCAALSAKQFSNIPVKSLKQGSSSTGLQYKCSSKFNGNNNDVLTLMSGQQLQAIAPLAFANIPVNVFKMIPSDIFKSITPEQVNNMRSSETNNQCATLSADQFSNIPADSLKIATSTTGLVYGCSLKFNDDVFNFDVCFTAASDRSSNICKHPCKYI
jgi:hypothetical protein